MAVSPASAEEPITLSLDGYMNNYFSFGGYDEAHDGAYTEAYDLTNTGLFSDGEVWFVGETTLDNGISFGANIQLESFTSGDQIDENYGYAEGSFGRVQFGSENSAAYLMQYGAPNVGVPINSGWVTVFVPAAIGPGFAPTVAFRHPAVSTYGDYGNDENQLTYFTPRFSGFQVGVSYAPTVTGGGDGANFPVVGDDSPSFGPGNGFGDEGHNGISVGANFVESFDGVDIAIAGGYRRQSALGNGNSSLGGESDWEQFSGGINVGFGGFTVGGSMLVEDSALSTEGWSFDVGASYATGPWAFGVNAFHSKSSGTIGNGEEDEMTAIKGGVSYAIGPGISGSASILWAEWEDELEDVLAVGNFETTGVVGVVGVTFSF